MKLLYKFFLLAFSILIISCAQVVSPSGGAQDTTPPLALKYTPDSAATNFKSKNVLIQFDEYIQLRDVTNQVVISPPFPSNPEIKAKGKNIIIAIPDTLAPNTTYTINFGSSISDITENNAAGNFQYLFSTGTYLDSLSVTGNILNAFDNSPPKSALIMLYKSNNDSTIYKEKPSYFAKAGTDGSFKINNIKGGSYKVAALTDLNANYLFDNPEELVGFLDSAITVSGKTKPIKVNFFKELPTRQFLKKYYPQQHGKLSLVFNIPLDSFSLTPLGKASNFWNKTEINSTRDTLVYWYKDVTSDSLLLQVRDRNVILDTAEFKLVSRTDRPSGRGSRFQLLAYVVNFKNKMLNPEDSILLELSHPIEKVFKEFIYLTNQKDTLPFSFVADSNKDRRFVIKSAFIQDSTYRLKILPGGFVDVFGLLNDTLNIAFKVQMAETLGNIKLNFLPAAHHNYIVQLLDEKDKPVKALNVLGNKTLDFKFLAPGQYKLKVIKDRNSNLKWDTGNYIKRVQPEDVLFYPKPVTVRANWDLELEWKVE